VLVAMAGLIAGLTLCNDAEKTCFSKAFNNTVASTYAREVMSSRVGQHGGHQFAHLATMVGKLPHSRVWGILHSKRKSGRATMATCDVSLLSELTKREVSNILSHQVLQSPRRRLLPPTIQLSQYHSIASVYHSGFPIQHYYQSQRHPLANMSCYAFVLLQ
jgi:hypothetical protein